MFDSGASLFPDGETVEDTMVMTMMMMRGFPQPPWAQVSGCHHCRAEVCVFVCVCVRTRKGNFALPAIVSYTVLQTVAGSQFPCRLDSVCVCVCVFSLFLNVTTRTLSFIINQAHFVVVLLAMKIFKITINAITT